MRIRKNAAKLMKWASASSISSSSSSSGHVICQLNQSPWDVISSSQFDARNGSFVDDYDSLAAVVNESVASMMMEEEEEDDKMEEVQQVYGNGMNIDDDEELNCNTAPSARNIASRPRKNCNTASSAARRGGKAKAAKKRATPASTSSSNPYEFYYYSGFGPRWGKQRRADRGDGRGGGGNLDGRDQVITGSAEMNGGGSPAASGLSRGNSSSPSMEVLDFLDEDYDDDEDEEEEEEEEIGVDCRKKRMRKPVKARSLKSLM
ncbi:hypothetical protein LINGRAHAP2_LOCUS16223 [Linum grandiflorum]